MYWKVLAVEKYFMALLWQPAPMMQPPWQCQTIGLGCLIYHLSANNAEIHPVGTDDLLSSDSIYFYQVIASLWLLGSLCLGWLGNWIFWVMLPSDNQGNRGRNHGEGSVLKPLPVVLGSFAHISCAIRKTPRAKHMHVSQHVVSLSKTCMLTSGDGCLTWAGCVNSAGFRFDEAPSYWR